MTALSAFLSAGAIPLWAENAAPAVKRMPTQASLMTKYTSETYFYEIQYPKSWTVIEAEIKGLPDRATWEGEFLIGEELHKVTFQENLVTGFRGKFQIRVIPNSDNLTLVQWIQTYRVIDDSGRALNIRKIYETFLSGMPAKKLSILDYDNEEIEILVLNGDLIYSIIFMGENPSDRQNERHTKVYELMLSTFKFTK